MTRATSHETALAWRWIALGAALGALAVAALLSIPPLTLDADRFNGLFTEGGPIETATAWAWIALAGLCLIVLRPTGLVSLAGCVLALAAAAREADWHKSFTGYSVMKIGYYTNPDHGVAARLLAFLAMALVIASAVIVVGAVIERWRDAEHDPPAWGVVTVIAVGWLVVTKAADRFRDVVGDLTGIEFSETFKTLLSSWEEGGELLLPALFGAAVWLYVRRPRTGPDAAASPADPPPPKRPQAQPRGRA